MAFNKPVFDNKQLPPSITSREYQVMALSLAENLSCKQIASQLNISEETIKKHRKNILKKFGLNGKQSYRQLLRILKASSYPNVPPK